VFELQFLHLFFAGLWEQDAGREAEVATDYRTSVR
jgi:hypothetical protein